VETTHAGMPATQKTRIAMATRVVVPETLRFRSGDDA
jgi:hypothetical protein